MTATFILYASKVKFEMCSLKIDAPLSGKICIISQPTSITTHLNEQWAITLQDDFIFYCPFQGGTSFVDLLCFCSVLCLLCFVRVCLYVLRGHLLGKG